MPKCEILVDFEILFYESKNYFKVNRHDHPMDLLILQTVLQMPSRSQNQSNQLTQLGWISQLREQDQV